MDNNATINMIDHLTLKKVAGDAYISKSKEWHNKVNDRVQDLLNKVDARIGDVITTVSYKEDGTYYTLCQKIDSNRDSDGFQAIFIYVPNFKELVLDALASALERLKDYLHNNIVRKHS